MIINLENNQEKPDIHLKSFGKLKRLLYKLSFKKCFTILCVFLIGITLFFISKNYIQSVIAWLENQDSAVVLMVMVLLFIVVSFPITVGYIFLVCCSGYLFGIFRGLGISVIGANTGLGVAHIVLKYVGHHNAIRGLTESDIAKAIARVITGPLCFKIVFCTRLTPIPFGLQNTIFAFSNVNSKVYFTSSLLGLLPGQIVSVYVGTTVRSVHDVLENRHISTTTYIFIVIQLIFGASVLVWVGAKARKELLKALQEGDSKISSKDRIPSFNIV